MKFKTPEELQEKVEAYFVSTGWVEKDVYDKKKQEIVRATVFDPPTVTGLAVYLDTTRDLVHDYSNGVYDEVDVRFAQIFKQAKVRCEHALEYGALTGHLNPLISIFSLKNNYNWKDKTEHDLTTGGMPIYGGKSTNSDKTLNGTSTTISIPRHASN